MEKCIDISRHQTSFNASACKSSGVTTVLCRLAYGNSQDVKVSEYMTSAKNAGLSIGGYGFGTWHYKSKCNGDINTARSLMRNQVESWIEIAKKFGCNSWIGIDQELEANQSLGLSLGDNTALLCEAAQMIEDAGLYPCLYASASWIIAHVSLTSFKWPLWVAYYKWYGTQKNFDNAAESFPSNSGTYGKWMNGMKERICLWQFTSEGYADMYGCVHGSNGLDKNWMYFQPSKSVKESSSNDTTASTGKDFDEYCLFPMDVLRVTQGAGFTVDGVSASTYSHLYQKAYDIAGADGGKSPVRAPFSCVVKRIYNGSSASSKCNFTWYSNTKYVKARNGKIYSPGMLLFMTAHCDSENLTKYGIKVGATFAQGSICGYEGTAGCSGAHCHISFGEGPWDGYGWHAIGSSRPGSYEMNNSVYMHQICWLRSDCVVKNGGGYTWETLGNSNVGFATVANTTTSTVTSQSETSVEKSNNVIYFAKYTGTSTSIVTALKSIGEESSYAYREAVAKVNNITNYKGTAAQNIQMVNLLKQGKLIKSANVSCFTKYTGNSGSIVVALNAIGSNSSYAYRSTIAKANGIDGYRGTAAQNMNMLYLLKQGKLIKP